MATFHELADLLRSLGIDLHDLPALLAKKAGTKGLEKLAGLSKVALRWPAVMYAVQHDASLLKKFRAALVDGSFPALQVAEIFRAAKNLDVAAEYYHKGLQSLFLCTIDIRPN